MPVEDLDLIAARRPSRYCESDQLLPTAQAEFSGLEGKALLDAVSSWVGARLSYIPGSSKPTDGATETLLARQGVCRDYAHLVVALLRGARRAGPARRRLRARARADGLPRGRGGVRRGRLARRRRDDARAALDPAAHRDGPGRRRHGVPDDDRRARRPHVADGHGDGRGRAAGRRRDAAGAAAAEPRVGRRKRSAAAGVAGVVGVGAGVGATVASGVRSGSPSGRSRARRARRRRPRRRRPARRSGSTARTARSGRGTRPPGRRGRRPGSRPRRRRWARTGCAPRGRSSARSSPSTEGFATTTSSRSPALRRSSWQVVPFSAGSRAEGVPASGTQPFTTVRSGTSARATARGHERARQFIEHGRRVGGDLRGRGSGRRGRRADGGRGRRCGPRHGLGDRVRGAARERGEREQRRQPSRP